MRKIYQDKFQQFCIDERFDEAIANLLKTIFEIAKENDNNDVIQLIQNIQSLTISAISGLSSQTIKNIARSLKKIGGD